MAKSKVYYTDMHVTGERENPLPFGDGKRV